MNSLECDKGILMCITVLTLCCSIFSCTGPRKAIYFHALTDSVFQQNIPSPALVIRPHDLLEISVSALNSGPNNPSSANTDSARMQQSANILPAHEYLVEGDGTLLLPLAGQITAAGLTKEQLRKRLADTLAKNTKIAHPLINIRVKTFTVTVLGEVGKPGTFQVPAEKISIMQAIGMAGDVSINGRRDNVLLVREEGGKRVSRRINLHSLDLFASPYYYLRPDDLLYVEPDKARLSSTSRARLVMPVVASVLSLGVIVLDRVVWR